MVFLKDRVFVADVFNLHVAIRKTLLKIKTIGGFLSFRLRGTQILKQNSSARLNVIPLQ